MGFKSALFFSMKRSLWVFGIFICQMIWAAQPILKNKLTEVSFTQGSDKKVELILTFESPIPDLPKSFITQNPPRIILDFPNVANGLKDKKKQLNMGMTKELTFVESDDRIRVMIDLIHSVPYALDIKNNQVMVSISAEKDSAYKQTFASLTSPVPQPNHTIQKIGFQRGETDGGQVIVNLSDASMQIDVNASQNEMKVDFIQTDISNEWVKNLDVKDFATPVDAIDVKRDGSNTQLIIKTHGEYDHLAYQVDDNFIIDVRPAIKNKVDQGGKEVSNPAAEKISLNFQDIKVRSVLQLLADFSNENIVASDSVTGNITLRLNNIPWDEALDIILKTRGLTRQQSGHVMMIAPSAEVASQEEMELKSRQAIDQLTPLSSQLIQINYALAADVEKLVKSEQNSLLSSRGKISSDERTNTVWVQDTPEKIKEVSALIHQLDIPVKQVLIEARIVNISKNYEKDLGVRFGVTNPANNISGSLKGANAIVSGTSYTAVPFTDRLNVNLAAAPTSDTAGRFGMALANLGQGIFLDMELSALETEGKGEIISSPRLVTANQQPATIESGEEIPYQEASSSGATTVSFKKAVLSLKVTPQITPDHRIILKLEVNQDKRSSLPEVNGVPAIDTRHIESQVLLNNGETIVLGGIYEQNKQSTLTRIPFFSNIPFFGVLFKSRANLDNQTELLIFVTPKIIQKNALQEAS